MKLIAKEKVISAIHQYEDWGCPATGSAISAVQEVAQIVGKIPTLTLDDLRPKGHWNVVEFDKVSRRITIECSECGMVEEMTVMAYGFGHNFCHICGADMRGGGEDEC